LTKPLGNILLRKALGHLRDCALQHTELVLKRANLYSASLSDSTYGTTRSLEHTVQSLDQKLTQAEKDVAECRKRVTELEAKVGEPSEHEAKLKSRTQRQDEIVKTLDLNRNQASNKLDAGAPPEKGETQSEKVNRSLRARTTHDHKASAH
jgi:chromosome segregation ATPase